MVSDKCNTEGLLSDEVKIKLSVGKEYAIIKELRGKH